MSHAQILRRTAVAGGALAVLLVGTAIAQTPSPPPRAVTPATPAASSVLVMQHETEKSTAEMIGMPVFSPDGATVGKISNLLIDQDQQVTGAVLSVGGFLGIGSKTVAVPWASLKFDEKGGKQLAIEPMSSEELAKAPEFRTLAQLKSERDAERLREEQKSRDMSRPSSPAPRAPQ